MGSIRPVAVGLQPFRDIFNHGPLQGRVWARTEVGQRLDLRRTGDDPVPGHSGVCAVVFGALADEHPTTRFYSLGF